MTYELDATPLFTRKVRTFRRRHPDLVSTLDGVLVQLAEDPYGPALRLHQLIGRLDGFHAVSVTFQYRIVLVLRLVEGVITLVNIGSHDDVYR